MTQPDPHHCSHPAGQVRTGCPRWPACLGLAPDALTPPSLGQSLATLAGWAAGAVLFLVVAAALLPLFI